jgi:Domain of unknown function (DUF4160)
MPRIKGIPGPYRLFFTSFDCNEPPHVHVELENATCKFWLQPIGLARAAWLRRTGAKRGPPDHCDPPRRNTGGLA